ncbi:restriction endonuclease subunit S [Escherichia coli]|uniref:restriction endonuclease subunit S n=1 Tax=Escherichia TaxID=561 RepID=UPI000984B5AB|nr:restriction endonuclease subunit S [Escherichia coli]EFV3706988.1 restriction endonuclease subunit S [Salmonella enterica]AZW06100.1 restriction endonuclease subunit S [Escherichia coli]EEW0594142.1 restriction endonuclease subunit S [Escherichia coli]EEY9630434.1 restriction endonuclease subunit S [Escherichia coli]EFB1513900.1 restriction endonuclease subunit S [Escherichia coli]
MSEMSYLEKLLDGVEVEWLPLAKVCRLINGRAYKQEELLSKGKYPVLRVGNFFTNQNWYYSDLELDQDKYCDNGDLLYAWSASFGPRIWHGGKSIYHYHIWKVVPDSNLICKQFLYYLLQWDTKALKDAHSTGSTMMHISKTTIEKRLVPIPCPDNPEKSLAIQSEIVRILDKFTALTAELTAELNMRKKQYNYYRDQLLRFKEGEVEWKALDDVFDIVAGGDAPKDALSEFETEEFSIPVLSNGIGNKSLYGWTDRAKIEKPSLTISARGTIGWTSYRSRPFFPIVRLLVLTPKIKLNLKYAYYFMKTIENNYKIPEAGIPQLTKPMLKDIKIPFPCPGNPEESYNEQARIAATLDKFDILTNSITEGLPREIELRQKQYEYYRDLLFSFPKPETVSN